MLGSGGCGLRERVRVKGLKLGGETWSHLWRTFEQSIAYVYVYICVRIYTGTNATCDPHCIATVGTWSLPTQVPVPSSAHRQQTHLPPHGLILSIPALEKPSPRSATHCSQFSLLSCRSARNRLDARASSSRSSSCRCSSRMAERIRRRSARSAVTSSCKAGGSEGRGILSGAKDWHHCPRFCPGHNEWLVPSLSTTSLPRACLPLMVFRGDLAHSAKDPEEPTDHLLWLQSQQPLTQARCQAVRHSFM